MNKGMSSIDGKMCAALIAGVVLGCVIGFVIGWGWDKRDGALASVSLLSLMTAIGTCGAVIAALWLSFENNRQLKSERASYAQLYLVDEIRPKLVNIFIGLNKCLMKYDSGVLGQLVSDKIWMSNWDLESLVPIDREIISRLLKLRRNFTDFVISLEANGENYGPKEFVIESRKNEIDILLSAISERYRESK